MVTITQHTAHRHATQAEPSIRENGAYQRTLSQTSSEGRPNYKLRATVPTKRKT